MATTRLRKPKMACNDSLEVIGSTNTYKLADSGLSFVRTAVSTSPYSVLESDEFVGVDSSGGAITVNLPEISGLSAQKRVYITDEAGTAATNNITIATAGSDTVLGAASLVINQNYSSYSLYSDGGTKWVVF